MIKGGYKIVNFNGAALSGTAVTLSGIYDQIVDDYGKSIMVSGVSLNSVIMDDAYAGVQEKTVEGSKVVELTVYGGIITVTEDDEVTFASLKSNGELSAEIGDLQNLTTDDKTSLVSAINTLKLKIISIDASATTHNITIPSSSRHLITVVSNNPDLAGCLILVGCANNGDVRILEVSKGSALTITTETNKVILNYSSGTRFSLVDIALVGNYITI